MKTTLVEVLNSQSAGFAVRLAGASVGACFEITKSLLFYAYKLATIALVFYGCGYVIRIWQGV